MTSYSQHRHVEISVKYATNLLRTSRAQTRLTTVTVTVTVTGIPTQHHITWSAWYICVTKMHQHHYDSNRPSMSDSIDSNTQGIISLILFSSVKTNKYLSYKEKLRNACQAACPHTSQTPSATRLIVHCKDVHIFLEIPANRLFPRNRLFPKTSTLTGS